VTSLQIFTPQKTAHIYILPWRSTPAARLLNPAGTSAQFERSRCAILGGILIYNDPLSYAELILNGDPEKYLRTVTETPQLDFD